MTQQLTVTGMTCENCAKHVRAALLALPGVRSVNVDWSAGKAQLAVDRELDRETLSRALEAEDYALA